jgi:hypothetical protein
MTMTRGLAGVALAVLALVAVQAPVAARGWDSGWYVPDPPVFGHHVDWRDGHGVVRCESWDGRTAHCRVDTRGGVVLVSQLSRAGCWEGRTWGWDRGGIWVTDGCRADFRVLGWSQAGWDDWRWRDDWRGRHDWRGDDWRRRHDWRGRDDWRHARRIVSESDRGRYRECRIPIARGVELVRQFSRGHCQLGVTWGWNRGVVWVDRGCRAEFVVY